MDFSRLYFFFEIDQKAIMYKNSTPTLSRHTKSKDFCLNANKTI